MDALVAQLEPLIPGLRRYARGLVRDADAADDLVQDTLERAISRWGQRRGQARPWVYAILHNLAVSRGRRLARRGPHLELGDAPEAALAEAATQEGALRQADLLRAVADLPEEQRAVLLLVSVEGLGYAEASEVLGAPLGTVMSRLSRARDRLRRAMDADAPAIPHLRRIK